MKRIVVGIILFMSSVIYSQNKDKNLFKGTESFTGKKYISAETDFRISQSNNEEKKAVANYNLGNSIYRQNQPGEAKYKFLNAVEVAKTKEEKHKAFHNLGNTLMLEENYSGAVEAYKNALRNNPSDDETRYNYALAKQKLKENPPKDDKEKKKDKDKEKQDKDKKEQDKKDQDKKEKEDKGKEKDKKDSDKGKEDDKKKEGDDKKGKQDGDKKEDENGNPKPSGANKQQIENLLNAVNNAEKKIQDKVNAKKVKVAPSTNEKDW
ncbi:tetratricopeptide repeat protein [Flavobacterium sp.]|uniref:tetratricopeptide repeat protein n=1 Tax=Flavobacterium sp. TaxID=239 RepID=UPI00404734E9